ncbi:MAG: phosphoribosyltransferase family protein [Nitrososphaeraceae archaeon]
MKFRDRIDAAEILAERLTESFNNLKINRQEAVILGIPRGGVIIADIVARKLSTGFDIVIGRKLGAPENKELAIGAVMEDGTSYINRYLVDALLITQEYIEKEKLEQQNEIKRRKTLYRKTSDYEIEKRVVTLVDDGIATGATIIAAARWIRKQRPKLLLLAVPVAPSQTVHLLRQEADFTEVVASPDNFNAVGEFYSNFDPVADENVIEVMKKRNLL